MTDGFPVQKDDCLGRYEQNGESRRQNSYHGIARKMAAVPADGKGDACYSKEHLLKRCE